MSVPRSDARFKRFPPRSGPVLVPITHRGAARTALALFGTSRPAALLAQRAVWTLAGVWGTRAIPGPTVTWEPREAAEDWQALLVEWSTRVGPFDHLAVHERRQTTRAGVGVLLLQGAYPVGFVKARVDDQGGLRREEEVLRALGSGTAAVLVPAPLGSGVLGRWSWLATTALPTGLHRPASGLPPGTILGLLQERLRPALQAFPSTPVPPPHWTPMHGDLAPWNLRQLAGGRLALLDWEDASWGPPGADEVYFTATSSALGRHGPSRAPRFPEAVDYWARVVRSRLAETSPGGADRVLGRRMLATLEAWGNFHHSA